MRYRSALICAAAIVGIAASGTVAAQEKAKPSDSSKRICRAQEEIGTRFKKRVCATALEWKQMDEIAEEARRNVDKIQRRACNGEAGCGG